jgi:hypothetical protein
MQAWESKYVRDVFELHYEETPALLFKNYVPGRL